MNSNTLLILIMRLKISNITVLINISISKKFARLAGGSQALIGDFPYLVASLHSEIRCTASLIHPEWVLGAAHCYVIDGEIVNECDVLLSAGIVDINDTISQTRQDRTAKTIQLHPNFEEVKISGSDVCLVNVDPFYMTDEVRPIPLSSEPFIVNKQVPCIAAGWGDTDQSESNNVLHKLNVVAIQSKKSCHGLSLKERNRMICLEDDNGRGLCDGDSGGPLICEDKLVGVAHQVYIEKFKYKGSCDLNCGSKSIVHTYMFICPYLNWIKSYVPEVPSKPVRCFEGPKIKRYG